MRNRGLDRPAIPTRCRSGRGGIQFDLDRSGNVLMHTRLISGLLAQRALARHDTADTMIFSACDYYYMVSKKCQ